MGVQGLWRLIEPSGKPVPLETLENKVLSVDVSIWLHQAIKGLQDANGASVPNAHLLSIYHRLCKLLFFRIKPIFVFDGGVPNLKRETIVKRQQQKSRNYSEANRLHQNLLSSLLKHSALSQVLSEKTKAAISPPKNFKNTEQPDDIFHLPPPQQDSTLSSEEDEGSSTEDSSPSKHYDLHSIDTKSGSFKALPVDVRHEILTDLKETRKQSSWGRIHELPEESNDFSVYQMNRLLKRQSVQSALEEAEKEMGGHSLSLAELERLLNDQGVITSATDKSGSRIASDENTRFLLIKDLKAAFKEAQKEIIAAEKDIYNETMQNKGEIEFEDELKKAIALSMECVPSTSKEGNTQPSTSNIQEKPVNTTFKAIISLPESISEESETSNDESAPINSLKSAQNYMTEYSGLTPNEIEKIISKKGTPLLIAKHTNTIADLSSEDSDDFLEVEEAPVTASVVDQIQIVIKESEYNIVDDLFEDIFVNKEQQINEKKIDLPEKTIPPEENEINTTNQDVVVIENKAALSESNGLAEIKESIKDMIDSYSKDTKGDSELTVGQMDEIRQNMQKEQCQLAAERSNKERLARNISDQMYQEAQELLELFGVPYLIAPMEAEAQCAFLELVEITKGTVTDDSDIWLFGGKTVYKNFFNDSKHVMEFRSENIERHYKLSREQMILLAMLVGSDYTVGISGVGPVTALEILAAFPPNENQLISGLTAFSAWLKKENPQKKSLRSKLKNVRLSRHFPNVHIAQAYLEPQVETSKDKFTWAKPDYEGLVDFAKRKFGWSLAKTEGILNPVMKRLDDTKSQRSILDYIKVYPNIDAEEIARKMSKRVKTAVSRIGQSSLNDSNEEEKPKKQRKRRKNTTEDMDILRKTKDESKKRLHEINDEALASQEKIKLHKKEVIPQKQKDKSDMLKNKLKAIETFRKSKQGPGFLKKSTRGKQAPQKNADYLSESSSEG